ncbi:MAG: asparagine synthase-related protein [Halarcobacter sp.]
MNSFLCEYKKNFLYPFSNNDNIDTFEYKNITCTIDNKDSTYLDIKNSFFYILIGDIYNIDELYILENLNKETTSKFELIETLYQKYDKNIFDMLIGDWFLLIYNSVIDSLIFAQSHLGFCAIYYYMDDNKLFFSNTLEKLLNIDEIPKKVNYNYIKNIQLFSIPNQYNETSFLHIKTLNPGKYMYIDKNNFIHKKYWYPENLEKNKSIKKEEAIIKVKEIFTEAIRARIKDKTIVSSMLSGGLDSSSVSIISSILLKEKNKKLNCFSHIPAFDVDKNKIPKNRISSEEKLILKILDKYPNIKENFVDSKQYTILDGIDEYINTFNEIPLNLNAYWLIDICKKAKELNSDILLTGDLGNYTISYKGAKNSLNIFKYFKLFGLKHTLKEKVIKKLIFYKYKTIYTINSTFIKESYINKRYINRYKLFKFRLIKMNYLNNGKFMLAGHYQRAKIMGGFVSQLQLNISDPSSDKELIEFLYQLPQEFFFSKKGEEKDIIKNFMKDLTPDKVLFQKKRGLQASDIFERILLDVDKIENIIKNFKTDDLDFELFNKTKMLEDLERLRKKELPLESLHSLVKTVAQMKFINYVKDKYKV